MAEENKDNIDPENKDPKKEGESNPPSPPPPPPFAEPKVLEGVIDPKQTSKEGATPFSFTNPNALHSDMAQPAKGDAEAIKKKSLAELDAQIAKDERAGEQMDYDDYKDNAQMILDMYEGALTWFARWYSKDTSDSAWALLMRISFVLSFMSWLDKELFRLCYLLHCVFLFQVPFEILPLFEEIMGRMVFLLLYAQLFAFCLFLFYNPGSHLLWP